MSTQDPNKDIRRILRQFFVTAKNRPAFKGMEEIINEYCAEINAQMLGTEEYPCPDIDHFKGLIGDNEQITKFIDWLLKRRAMPALMQSIHDRMSKGEPSFIRVMFNPGERVGGGNDDVHQNLRNQITALSAQNTALNTQYAEVAGKLQEEQRTTGLQLSEISRLGREKASLEADAAKVAGLEAQNRSLQERIGRLEEKNADLVKESKETGARLEEKQENLHELQRLIEEMTLEKNAAKDTTRVNDDENAGAKKAKGKDMKEEESHDEEDEEASDENDDVEASDENDDVEASDENDDAEASDENDDVKASDENDDVKASDGNEDEKEKQDVSSLLSSAVHIIGNAAADAASGAVGYVTKGVANAFRSSFKQTYNTMNFRRTPNKVTSQPDRSGKVHLKRSRNDDERGNSKKPRSDGNAERVPKRTHSNTESTKDGDARSSHDKKPRRA